MDLRTGSYDKKIAAIQAKRIYKKFLKLLDKETAEHDDIKDLFKSFDFFIDIIHLIENPEGEDIQIINVFRGKTPERKVKDGLS